MSSVYQHLRRAPSLLSSTCRTAHSTRLPLRGLSSTPVTYSESAQEARARPRVVFSGIQPTGIPHVRRTRWGIMKELIPFTAREPPWSTSELGEIAARRRAGRPAHILHCRMARTHLASRPQGSQRVASRHARGVACSWTGPEEVDHFPPGRGACRSLRGVAPTRPLAYRTLTTLNSRGSSIASRPWASCGA